MSDYRLVQHRGNWSLAFNDAERGRVRIALGTDDRGLAEARARELWNARNKPAGERVADLWPSYVKSRKDEGARADRWQSIWAALKPHFGHRLGAALSVEDCKEYAAARARQGMRPSTIKTELELLRACLRHHLGHKAPRIWLPVSSPPRDRWLTQDELNTLLSHIETPHIRLFVILAVTTGARMSAILDLTWDRVDFDAGSIDFQPAGRHITNKRRTVVPMNRRSRESLLEAREAALTDNVIEYAGQPVASIKKGLQAASRRSGIQCSPHDLRRTAGVWMAKADVPMEKIAQFLGHTSTRVTQLHYARYAPSFMRDAASALDF